MTPLVSVIIPVYKVPEEWLHRCIKSAVNQTLKEIEIILVDDGSPDNCGLICDEYAAKDNRIKVIHKENGGVSSARNIGLDNATGKYIMFADADDRIEQNAADILLSYRESTKADLVVCGYYRDDEKVYYKGKSVKFLPKITAAQAIAGKYKYVLVYLWNKLFSKEIIDNAKIRFDETIAICEDSLFCQKYVANCNKIVCVNELLYHYETNKNSAIHAKFSKNNVTVFSAYKKIINFCNNTYRDKKLSELLYANYYCHYIRNLRRIKNELSCEERVPFKYVYDFVKTNIKNILLNKRIHLKTKLLVVYLILALKNDE